MPNPNLPSSAHASSPPSAPAVPATPVGHQTTTSSGSVRLANAKRGEVYWVDIPKKHTVGSEQYKRRPFLIVSNNSIHYLKIVIGVPLSLQTQKTNRQFRIRVAANEIIMDQGSTLTAGERIALTEQVRCLSILRLEPDRQAKLTDTAISA